MLGSYGVGKTSLVGRFVHSIFSEKYQSTIGVKIDRKSLCIDGKNVSLLLWDLHGDDEFQRVRRSYLRGMAGYILVVDSTRNESLQVAIELHQMALETVGEIPFLVLVNKCDLQDEWSLDRDVLTTLEGQGWNLQQTSAKTGKLVNESFELLAERLLSDS